MQAGFVYPFGLGCAAVICSVSVIRTYYNGIPHSEHYIVLLNFEMARGIRLPLRSPYCCDQHGPQKSPGHTGCFTLNFMRFRHP